MEQLVGLVEQLAVHRMQSAVGVLLCDGTGQPRVVPIPIGAAMYVKRAGAFGSGLLAVVSLHAVYGWWLNSGARVLGTLLVLLVLSAVVSLSGAKGHWDRAVALWLGAISASAAVLFWIGPGSIWPIALAVAAALSAGAVLAGTLIGVAANARRR